MQIKLYFCGVKNYYLCCAFLCVWVHKFLSVFCLDPSVLFEEAKNLWSFESLSPWFQAQRISFSELWELHTCVSCSKAWILICNSMGLYQFLAPLFPPVANCFVTVYLPVICAWVLQAALPTHICPLFGHTQIVFYLPVSFWNIMFYFF